VHAFYYLWYGVPAVDGKWLHWDHKVLPHWDRAVKDKHAHLDDYRFEPPTFLHSPRG
jgi:glycoprotein endo-alpha-1,2-mannosidase